MSDLPPLPALRCFEAVARLGSITRAALALHVTHSAVSQQVRQLEELLGLSLFEREGRGLRLSENGRLYALQVREALQQIGAATRALRIRPRDGELVVALIPSFGQHWLLPRLQRFMQRCPGQRLRLLASLEPQELRQGAAHVAIRMGHGGWEGLEQQHLFEDALLMVAAPHFNGGALPRTPAEVLASPLIRSVEPWTPWCTAAGLAEPASSAGLWINDSNLSLEAARLGQGVALERLSVAHALLSRGELVQLTDLRVPYAYPYWLVWPPTDDARVQGSRQAFAQWLQDEVRQYLAEQPDANAAIVR